VFGAAARGGAGTGPASLGCGLVMSLTTIAQRLDQLPWSSWHWRVIFALGITWVLDGLEVTVVGSLGGILQRSDTLALSAAQVGWSGSAYIGGAVIGALVFGRLTDRWGRKRLFIVTLAVYSTATTVTGLAPDFAAFFAFRALTGLGIGGEYAAINSAVDELVPARLRGTVNLALNGTFWLGAALGALLAALLLDPNVIAPRWGWRFMFFTGAVIAVGILFVRRHVPESPRWLATRGRDGQAEQVIAAIEAHVTGHAGSQPPRSAGRPAEHAMPEWGHIVQILAVQYRTRTVVALSLMIAQAFFYNAIFFTYALVLTKFYAVAPEAVWRYLLWFAAGNFLGPLVLGRLFDVIGRRQMIAATYSLAGFGLLAVGYAFTRDWLTAATQTLGWAGIFFVASAAASSAYLTISELFPLEVRAVAIALFYAVGTAAGGFLAPALLATLIATGSRTAVYSGYVLGATLMLVAAAIVLRWGVAAERKPLEEIAAPLLLERERSSS
jgi:MFS family permease